MAFRRTISSRLAHLSNSSPAPSLPPRPSRRSLSGGSAAEKGGAPLRRFFQRRPIFNSAAAVPVPPGRFPALPVGDELLDRIRSLTRDRIRLEGIAPPPPLPAVEDGITVAEVRKALRAAQMEAARARLRGTTRSCVSYSEFAQTCNEVAGAEHGSGLARALDEAGAVIVMGDVVFLRPELVARAIEGMIPLSMAPAGDPRRAELKEMEDQKAAIDGAAEAQVRRELWCGLGLLAAQTLGFMRLTFWELSWDVMEPICFYVTSAYFMAGYAFFLRTSRDPSFEGFFQSRFAAKQKRLMAARGFDVDRFSQLKRAAGGGAHTWSREAPCDCRRSTPFVGPTH